MIFNNSANGVLLNQKYKPVNGNYKFQVLEIYDDLSPSFEIEVPANEVEFISRGKTFELKVEDKVFGERIKKAESFGCREMYVYPKFQ